MDKDIVAFIIEHGYRAPGHELAAVIGCSESEIAALRRSHPLKRRTPPQRFWDLFPLWRGRAPRDDEWPKPRRYHGAYEWQGPELALLASLVGRIDKAAIADTLTNRLRQVTGDNRAKRSAAQVQLRMCRIGIMTTDVLGGITTKEAGRQIGSRIIVHQAIRLKQLRTRRVGRLHVIDRDEWEQWKAARIFPPKGYVPLREIKSKLSIRSDKLSEFARDGLIPTAIRCNPFGTHRGTKWGTWYIDGKLARKLVDDRRAGRPMPWHGAPNLDNLRVTYKLWLERKHPADCKTCAQLWGRKGAPKDFDEYCARYHPLAHGAKRHLTRPWFDGLTVAEVARVAGRSSSQVMRAIEGGSIQAERRDDGRLFITRTEATRWRARKCPTGGSFRSWVSLDVAARRYHFGARELRGYIDDGTLKSKIGTDGAQRGVTYVLAHQCALLRERLGFTEEQAAARLKITLPRLRALLEGVDWRGAERIPLVTLQAVQKRLQSRHGFTIEEAAAKLGVDEQWVHDRITDGTIKIMRAPWDQRRRYVSDPMFARLETYKRKPPKVEHFNSEWLLVSEAAHEAGVEAGTINKWADAGEVVGRKSKQGMRYHRRSIRARARKYWETVRFRRAALPEWLSLEKEAA